MNDTAIQSAFGTGAQPRVVHFVCIGNTYRSRMAEAYFASLGKEGWRAVSSGVRASRNLNGPITHYAALLLAEHALATKEQWTQTTVADLAASDLVVFMHEECRAMCETDLEYLPGHFQVWDVTDMGAHPDNGSSHDVEMSIAREAFVKIQRAVDVLVLGL